MPGCIEEVYDLESDPDELDNLAVRATHKDLVLALRREAEQNFLEHDGEFVRHLPNPKPAWAEYGEKQ